MNICSIYYHTNKKSPFKHGGLRLKNKDQVSKRPLVSLITVVKNRRVLLEETFKSVFNQKFKDFEYIVIDGNSEDGSLSVIKKYEDKIDYWISDNDNGIYDAFNKGLDLARGELIGFVNSDDLLTPDALKILDEYNSRYPNKDFFFGAVQKHWGILHGYRPYKINWSWGFYSSHSTGFFIRNSAAKLNGYYNINYKYSADYDYFYRMIKKNKLDGIGTRKDELFGIFRRGGFSSQINFYDHFKEEIKIRLDNGQNKLLVLCIFIYKYLKNIKKIIK